MKDISIKTAWKSLVILGGAASSFLSTNASAQTLVEENSPKAYSTTIEQHPLLTPEACALPMYPPWQDFCAHSGQCTMRFPGQPDHLSEKLRLEDSCELKYDAYIVAAEPQTVYMLLIAQYPAEVSPTYARASLEGFLNGVLTHNPNNQLLCADLSLIDGNEALDFFIRSGGVYFRGRAILAQNSLYLMAIECEVHNYDDSSYNAFVSSFKLTH